MELFVQLLCHQRQTDLAWPYLFWFTVMGHFCLTYSRCILPVVVVVREDDCTSEYRHSFVTDEVSIFFTPTPVSCVHICSFPFARTLNHPNLVNYSMYHFPGKSRLCDILILVFVQVWLGKCGSPTQTLQVLNPWMHVALCILNHDQIHNIPAS